FCRVEPIAEASGILPRDVHEVLVVEDDLTSRDRRIPREKRHDREPHRGLPAAAFTSDAKDLAAPEPKADPIQRLVHSPARLEMAATAAHREGLRHTRTLSAAT